MRFAIIVPTTRRPIFLTRLTQRTALPTSVMIAEGDYRPLPQSGDYDQLLRAGGPLSRASGGGALPAHELHLSEAFEAGRSWEVPVCIAHLLAAEGHELVGDPELATVVCWATGAVDFDLKIVPDRYYLVDKLRAQDPRIAKAREKGKLLCLLPSTAHDWSDETAIGEAAAHVGITTRRIGSIAAARDLLAEMSPALRPRAAASARAAAAATVAVAEPARAAVTEAVADTATAAVAGKTGGAAGVAAALAKPAGLFITAKTAIAGVAAAAVVAGGIYFLVPKPIPAPTPGPVVSTGGSGAPTGGSQGGTGAGTVATSDSGADAGTAPAATETEQAPPATEDAAPELTGEAASTDPAAATGAGTPPDASGGTPAAGTPAGDATKPEETKADGTKPEDATTPGTAATGPAPVVIEETRAPSGANCLDVLFGNVRAEVVTIEAVGGVFPKSSRKGLCGLTIKLRDGAASQSFVLGGNIKGSLRSAKESRSKFDKSGISSFSGTLPREGKRLDDYGITVKSFDGGTVKEELQFSHGFID